MNKEAFEHEQGGGGARARRRWSRLFVARQTPDVVTEVSRELFVHYLSSRGLNIYWTYTAHLPSKNACKLPATERIERSKAMPTTAMPGENL